MQIVRYLDDGAVGLGTVDNDAVVPIRLVSEPRGRATDVVDVVLG
jgi:hypothetical protein